MRLDADLRVLDRVVKGKLKRNSHQRAVFRRARRNSLANRAAGTRRERGEGVGVEWEGWT